MKRQLLAASAEAKWTGKLAVCFGSAGSGAIHLLNDLYDARHYHSFVLALIGWVPLKDMSNEWRADIYWCCCLKYNYCWCSKFKTIQLSLKGNRPPIISLRLWKQKYSKPNYFWKQYCLRCKLLKNSKKTRFNQTSFFAKLYLSI